MSTLTSTTQNTIPKFFTFSPRLPPETWNLIFVFATWSESRGFSLDRCRLTTKRSLVLVCKSWHAIALPLLYEIVWIREISIARQFLRTLVDTSATDPAGFGKWVRTLILPRGPASTKWNDFQVVDVLNRCPNIRVLSKLPDNTTPERWTLPSTSDDFYHGIACNAACPTFRSFTSLKIVLWYCARDPGFVLLDAVRLSTLLRHAPNLVSLRICSGTPTLMAIHPPPPDVLPLTITLLPTPFAIRLHSSNPLTKLTTLEYIAGTEAASFCLRQTDMPKLSHITAGIAALFARRPIEEDEDHSSLLAAFGEQLTSMYLVDSTPSARRRVVYDIRSIFRRCPNLRLIHVNVSPTVLPTYRGVLHPSLSAIVLRIVPEQTAIDEELERSLRAYIQMIMGEAFPALRQVGLAVTGRSAEQFYPICRDLQRRFPSERVVTDTLTVWES